MPPSFLQALLCIISFVLFWCGHEEHLCFLVLSLALGWLNLLYFSRGFRHMGIYSVMIQKVTCHSHNPKKHRCCPLFTTKCFHFTQAKSHLCLFLSRLSLKLTDTSWWYHALPFGLHCLPLWVFSWYLVVVISFARGTFIITKVGMALHMGIWSKVKGLHNAHSETVIQTTWWNGNILYDILLVCHLMVSMHSIIENKHKESVLM